MANKDKLLESAQKFLAKGQLGKAIGEYQKLIEAFPKDFRNRQKLAELLSREKHNDEAQPHFEAVAKNFTETGFYLKAIAIYKQMQKIEPARVDIYLRLAELNEKQGLIGNALNEYRSLVTFYEKNRMVRESIGILQKMVALDPENLGVRGKLIESQMEVGEQQDALEQFRTLVGILDGKGEHAKVVKLYEKFLDLCPETVEHRLPLAEALLKAGQADKALAVLKSLLKQAPDHAGLLSILTDCHQALGNHDDARLACQHLLKEQPQDLALRERHLRLCIAAGDYERALDSLEDSKDAFFQADRLELLRELYEVLQVALPENPRLRATLVALYESSGQPVASPAPAGDAGRAPEETVDAAVVDVALRDVEELDLVGESVTLVTEVPPLGASAPAKPAKGGGLELELDLDLDLEAGDEPVPAPIPPAAPQPAGVTAEPDELELELDLGGLDDLTSEPPPVDTETGAEEAVETPAPSGGEEIELPDFGGVEFETEPAVASAVTADAWPGPDFAEQTAVAEPVAETAADAAAPFVATLAEPDLDLEAAMPGDASGTEEDPLVFSETLDVPRFEAVDLPPEVSADVCAVEESPVAAAGDWAAAGDAEAFEATEEVEEIAEADVIEILEEIEEIEEVEPLEVLEELEDLEAAVELDEIEELEEVDEAIADAAPFAYDAPSAQQLRDEVEEAEFYLRQGLFDDAERIVHALQGRYGEQPELAAKLADIRSRRTTADTGDEQVAFHDLIADLKDEDVLGATDFLGGGESDEFSLAAVPEGEEDLQSHFDLGIAYKEMGLLEDAIAEFDKASRDPSRQLDCLTLKGQCLLEMGNVDAAEAIFKEALGKPDLDSEVRAALRYELGLLYEVAGRPLESLENFQLVADHDLFFREVTDKLKTLRQKLGIDDQAIESLQDDSGKRDRISYV